MITEKQAANHPFLASIIVRPEPDPLEFMDAISNAV
jgi:hypothetical protein